MTLQAAVEDFLIEQHIRGNTAKTVRYYALCLRLFARYAGESLSVSEITQSTHKAYIMHISGQSLSRVTVQT